MDKCNRYETVSSKEIILDGRTYTVTGCKYCRHEPIVIPFIDISLGIKSHCELDMQEIKKFDKNGVKIVGITLGSCFKQPEKK
jgi:hypothetical protein